jgi:hypothetical protein
MVAACWRLKTCQAFIGKQRAERKKSPSLSERGLKTSFRGSNSRCRWRDSNPHGPFGPTDFKSVASAIPPHRRAQKRIKPRTAGLASAISSGESNGCDLRSDTTTLNRTDARCLGFSPRQLIRLIDLGPKNRDLFRCFDSYLYRITVDPSDFDVDRITDHNTLIYLSR